MSIGTLTRYAVDAVSGLRTTFCLLLCGLVLGALAPRGSVFDLDTGRADRVVVTLDESAPLDTDHGSTMIAALDGVLGVYEQRTLAEIRLVRTTGRATSEPEPVWFAHLERRGEHAITAIGRTPDGGYAAARWGDGAATSPWLTLDPLAFGELRTAWPDARFAPRETDLPLAETVDMPRPYTPGRFLLDKETHDERLFAGRRTPVRGTERLLMNETLTVRLPAGYDGSPAGLLVWIDPTPGGRPFEPLPGACDELGFICVGAKNAGNDRPAIDRMQLALDGVATAAAHFRIDPERVYAVGMSGGGRISSMLWDAFPDVFRGAVPIVGLNCYEQVETFDGKVWAAAFCKPHGELIKRLLENRIAPISGENDFNYEQMRAYAEIYKRDGFQLRFFEQDGMGHEMPSPEVLVEALRWVDQPYQTKRAEATQRVQDLLDAYIEDVGERTPRNEDERARLIDVTNVGAWTEPAWRAAALLGYPAR